MHSVATAWGDRGEYQSDQPTQYVPLSILFSYCLLSFKSFRIGFVWKSAGSPDNLEVALKFLGKNSKDTKTNEIF